MAKYNHSLDTSSYTLGDLSFLLFTILIVGICVSTKEFARNVGSLESTLKLYVNKATCTSWRLRVFESQICPQLIIIIKRPFLYRRQIIRLGELGQAYSASHNSSEYKYGHEDGLPVQTNYLRSWVSDFRLDALSVLVVVRPGDVE